jgi:two-component system, LytTR family, response regulator
VKVTTLIVDDEPVARAGLREMLRTIEWVTIVGEASNGLAAAEMIDRLKPELVLLDVQMPGLLGTEVLARLEHQPYIVFTTAYVEHAILAFELGAIDYILKPFGTVRLGIAMERVRAALGEPAANSALERLGSSLGHGPISRLFVRSGGAIVPLAVDHVAWFAADGDYVVAHADRSRHLLHLSLARLELRLDAKRFLRIHRAHVINLDFVRAFRRGARGQLVAEMVDGTRLPVSRTRAQQLRHLAV